MSSGGNSVPIYTHSSIPTTDGATLLLLADLYKL